MKIAPVTVITKNASELISLAGVDTGAKVLLGGIFALAAPIPQSLENADADMLLHVIRVRKRSLVRAAIFGKEIARVLLRFQLASGKRPLMKVFSPESRLSGSAALRADRA